MNDALMQELMARQEGADPMAAMRGAQRIGPGPLDGVEVMEAGAPKVSGLVARLLGLLGPKAAPKVVDPGHRMVSKVIDQGMRRGTIPRTATAPRIEVAQPVSGTGPHSHAEVDALIRSMPKAWQPFVTK